MKVLSAIIICLLIIPVSAQEQRLGAEITLKEKTLVADILKDPQEYVGKRVLVQGKVLDVCQHAGCWMEISGQNTGEKIKVKVKDGEIVFPVEAAGNIAIVEGEVYAIEMTEEEALEFYEHAAEDAGKEFDPASVTGPVTVYQIKGLGAVINISETAPDVNQE